MKVCVVELGYNHTFCHDLNNHTDIEVREPLFNNNPVKCNPCADCCAEEGQHLRDVRRDHDPGRQTGDNLILPPPAQVPTMIYAVLAGSLSDKFGRGPLLVLPIVGQILEGIALLANTVTRTRHITRHKPYIFRHQVWFAELPLEALWLANVYDWFGGSAVWYLGVYTFAADITAPGERASRMAR